MHTICDDLYQLHSNLQSDCNGRGTCGCDGTCSCQDPYFGDYCELCSGSEGVYQVTLPEGACGGCDQGVVIINGTEEVDYMIGGECMHIIIIIASVKLLLIRLFVCLFVCCRSGLNPL